MDFLPLPDPNDVPVTSFETINEEVYAALNEKPMSATMLMNELDMPKSTVYRALKELHTEGRIYKYDSKRRGAKWSALNTTLEKTATIPRIVYKGTRGRITAITKPEPMANYIAQEATKAIVANIRVIANVARYHNGQPLEITLGALRDAKMQLMSSKTNIEDFVSFLDQIANNPVIWNYEKWEALEKDPDWLKDLPDIEKAYNNWLKEQR